MENIKNIFKVAIIGIIILAIIVMISIIKSPFLLIGAAIFFIFNIIFLVVLFIECEIDGKYVIIEEIEDYDFDTIEGIEDYYEDLDGEK